MPPQYTRPILRACEECGGTMRVEPNLAATKRFCSRACMAAGYRRRATAARTCEQCGVVFALRACEVRKGRGRYCSRHCAALAQRQGPARTCAHCGGTFHINPATDNRFCSATCYHAAARKLDVPEGYRKRRLAAYRAWRTLVYERDDYTCQQCGQRGGKLNAHHVKPWAHHPALWYEVSNGLTLCVACHRAVHATPPRPDSGR